jgi:hypothetical protein
MRVTNSPAVASARARVERERPQANQAPGSPRQHRCHAAECQQTGDSDAKCRVLAKSGFAERLWRNEKQDARQKEHESHKKQGHRAKHETDRCLAWRRGQSRRGRITWGSGFHRGGCRRLDQFGKGTVDNSTRYWNGSENFGSVRNRRSVNVFKNATSAALSDAVKPSGCIRSSLFGWALPPRL